MSVLIIIFASEHLSQYFSCLTCSLKIGFFPNVISHLGFIGVLFFNVSNPQLPLEVILFLRFKMYAYGNKCCSIQ